MGSSVVNFFFQLQDKFVWGASWSAIFCVCRGAYCFLEARREVLVSHSSVQDIDQKV